MIQKRPKHPTRPGSADLAGLAVAAVADIDARGVGGVCGKTRLGKVREGKQTFTYAVRLDKFGADCMPTCQLLS